MKALIKRYSLLRSLVTFYQSNDQFNVDCVGSGCFNQAFNLASQGFSENTALFESSIGNTVEQSNVQSIDGCVDGSSCTNFGSNFVSISD